MEAFLLDELIDLIGLEATKKLIAAKGGTRVEVPTRAQENRQLAEIIGLEALRKLVPMYGGSYLDLPIAEVWRQEERRQLVADLTAQGLSENEIALELRVTGRTVRNHRAALRDPEGQGTLF